MDNTVTFNVEVVMKESAIVQTALGFGWKTEVVDPDISPGDPVVMVPNPVTAQQYCIAIAKDRIVDALIGMSREAGNNVLTAQRHDLEVLLYNQTHALKDGVTITEVM